MHVHIILILGKPRSWAKLVDAAQGEPRQGSTPPEQEVHIGKSQNRIHIIQRSRYIIFSAILDGFR